MQQVHWWRSSALRGEPVPSFATVRVLPPSPYLRTLVRAYEYHPTFQQNSQGTLPVWPHPHAVLPIRFGDPLQIVYRSSRRLRVLPEIAVAGPVTDYSVDIVTRNHRLCQFVVVFQPGAVRRLVGVGMRALIDNAIPADEILGAGSRSLYEQLREASGPYEMAGVTDAYLLKRLAHAAAVSPIERAAEAQLNSRGSLPIADLIRESGYGRARFERNFVESVGVSPKLYARLVRFDYALRLRLTNRQLPWVTISHEAGYFDQNHLVKDFKALTGQPPSSLPEPDWRIFGGPDVSQSDTFAQSRIA